MVKVLLTGSNGFIGRGLAANLATDCEVIGFDRALDEAHDVTDYASIFRVVKRERADWIIHLAAQAFIPVGEADPVRDAKTNILGTLNTLLAAKEAGCKVIHCSSGAVYGDQRTMPVSESMTPNPQSYYGTSKLCAENYALHFARHRGLPVWVARFSSVTVRGRREGPVYFFTRDALKNGVVKLTGDGSQSRDITHIDDVSQGIRLLMNEVAPHGQVYNVACGKETTMLELAKRVFRHLGVEERIEHLPPRPGDIGQNVYDVSKLARYGYKPQKSVSDCIALTAEYVKEEAIHP